MKTNYHSVRDRRPFWQPPPNVPAPLKEAFRHCRVPMSTHAVSGIGNQATIAAVMWVPGRQKSAVVRRAGQLFSGLRDHMCMWISPMTSPDRRWAKQWRVEFRGTHTRSYTTSSPRFRFFKRACQPSPRSVSSSRQCRRWACRRSDTTRMPQTGRRCCRNLNQPENTSRMVRGRRNDEEPPP